MAQVKSVDAQPNVLVRMKTFFDDVMLELKKVSWPTVEDLKVSTKVTMYMLLIMAAITFFFDKVFELVMRILLGLGS